MNYTHTMIERSHLSILRAMDHHGSLTAAARSLSLTQSALSHSIRKLEIELNTEIWAKKGRKLQLTEAGKQLLTLGHRVLPQFEHTELLMEKYAQGARGALRIGMECHPCYRWLLKVVEPYLAAFPDVDLDVKQKFQFGGLGALFAHEIDMLITPDPLRRRQLHYEPVFDYEQVLVLPKGHPLSQKRSICPEDLQDQTLITYPVEPERLDIFSQFLTPAQVSPRKHKRIETTDIMLQMVACGRGLAALPGWLVDEFSSQFDITRARLGRSGIKKQIFVGLRRVDLNIDYVRSFTELARKTGQSAPARQQRARAKSRSK